MKLLLTHIQPKISKMKRSERQFHNFPKQDSVKRGCSNELWGLTRQMTCLISQALYNNWTQEINAAFTPKTPGTETKNPQSTIKIHLPSTDINGRTVEEPRFLGKSCIFQRENPTEIKGGMMSVPSQTTCSLQSMCQTLYLTMTSRERTKLFIASSPRGSSSSSQASG